MSRPEIEDIDDVEDDLDADESVYERLCALQDIIPGSARSVLGTFASVGVKGLSLAGKVLWVVVTSSLVLGLPLALEQEKEAMMEEYEKQQKAQEEQAALLYNRGPALNPLRA